jgi:CRISPR/Cas system-associated exonuclease Cas4 (RecB family)
MQTPDQKPMADQPDRTPEAKITLRTLNFSQSSLQDFADCPRRFQLRYLMEQPWPAPPAEPLHDVERADRLGKQFHLILERQWLGVPINRDHIEAAVLPWWDAFVAHPPADLPDKERRPEVYTSATVHGQRLIAKYDLLAYEPDGKAVIVDWKTSKQRPTRAWLDRRMQTIIYPLLLVESAPLLLGYTLAPENIRLVYWFANAPTEVEVFQYTTARYESDKRTLASTLDRLLSLVGESVWPLTTNETLCRLCQYRSLCDRGRKAGSMDEEYGEDIIETISEPTSPDDFVL